MSSAPTNRTRSRRSGACWKMLRPASISPPEAPSGDAARDLVRERKPNYFSYADWKKLDELEVAKAEGTERSRVKFTSIEEMLAALGRT